MDWPVGFSLASVVWKVQPRLGGCVRTLLQATEKTASPQNSHKKGVLQLVRLAGQQV